jgi:hypothetical protein
MPDLSEQRFTAAGIGKIRGKPTTFDADRICAESGCSTRLSTYNPRNVCWQHDPGRPYLSTPPRRRRRSKDQAPDLLEVRETGDLHLQPIDLRP